MHKPNPVKENNAAEFLFRMLADLSSAPVIMAQDGQVIYANPAAVRMIGLPADQVTGSQIVELIQPEDRQIIENQAPSEPIQMTLLLKNGKPQIFWYHTTSQLLNGNPAQVFIAPGSEPLSQQIESERAWLSTVFAHAPEAILVTDVEARIIHANPQAERLFAWPIPYGKSYSALADLQICYPDGQPYDPRDLPLTRSALDGEVISNLEAVVMLPNEGRRELLINAAPIYDRAGKLGGSITVAQDIGSRKQIEAQMRKNAARAEVLAALSHALAEAGLYYAAVLTTVTHQISEKIGDASLIRMVSDDHRWLDAVALHHPNMDDLSKLRKVLRKRRLRTNQGLSGQVYENKRSVLIQKSEWQPQQVLLEQEFGDWVTESQPESILVVPLQAQGSQIGTLTVIRLRGGEPYTADDRIFFANLADRAALAIENAILFANEARRVSELDALHRATAALLGTLDINLLLSQILDAAQQAIPQAEHGSLHLVEPQTGQLELRAELNDSRITHFHPNSNEYPAVVVRNQQPLLISDTTSGQDTDTGEERIDQPVANRSLIAAPLYIGDYVIGALSLASSRPNSFSDKDLNLLISFANTTSAAIQNAKLHAKLQTLAITDPLTEQYNRRGFFELAQREMERHSRYHYPLAAIMIDIDHFKNVNDMYGHRTGDRVLRSLAKLINDNIRQVDILGRYGGEEFALLLPETELFKACEIAERIRSAIASEPVVMTEQGPIYVSVSLGVTKASQSTMHLAELLEQADKALYKAKENGRNRVEVA